MEKQELYSYIDIKNKILTTTEIIKDSFKNAFKIQDKEGMVIVRNNRRDSESVLIDINKYQVMLKKIDELEEKLYDKWAENVEIKDEDFVDLKDVQF